MTTLKGLFPAHLDTHSWLLATPGLASTFEWPELTRINRDCRYLVQFAGGDPLFSSEGMHDADTWLRDDAAGTPSRYTGTWYDTGHVVTPAMLAETLEYFTVSL
ncbi:hypothetical protein [Arthrobacter subterraneus]